MENMDFVVALHPLRYLAFLGMAFREPDMIGRLGKAIGVTSGASSNWRTGRRRMSKAVQLLYRLAQIHGLDALLSGTLDNSHGKLAQDSAQPVAVKKRRKKRTK